MSSHTLMRRTLAASIMLVAFTSRALIPPGFMPAGNRPFSFEICWEDFPAYMLAQSEPAHADSMDMGSVPAESLPHGSPRAAHHHSGGRPHSEHCVFGTACSAGPITHLPLLSDISCARQLRAIAFVSVAGTVRRVYLPQPRAPPGRLS